MGDIFTLDSAHNFGIYTKSGKRSIFQIDFASNRICLIERGKIGKTHHFETIGQYDSEENLHIVIRFRNNKTLEFDADTAEEKYTICRLLGMILGSDNTAEENGVESRVNNGVIGKLGTMRQVIREGFLDKKGNTKIPTWSRRRLQVCPGEFSYYRPGDEVALNLVQLWENCTNFSKNGSSGFTVSVRDRSYSFRVLSEKGLNAEVERDRWIQAFQQASQRKRATFLLLEMSKTSPDIQGREGVPLPAIPLDDDDEDAPYYNQNHSVGSSSSANSQELLEGLEAVNELDEVLNDVSRTPQSKSRDICLSVVTKENPVLESPTKNRPRPPVFKGKHGTEPETGANGGQPLYEFIPEPDYSPPGSPRKNAGHQTGNPPSKTSPGADIGQRTEDKNSSGVYKRVIRPTNSEKRAESGVYNNVLIPTEDRESGAYKKAIELGEYYNTSTTSQNEQNASPTTGDYQRAIKPGPGAVDVMPKVTEIPKLKRVNIRDTTTLELRSPQEKVEAANTAPSKTDNATSVQKQVKQIQANFETNIYVNEKKDEHKPIKSSKTKPPPPAPSGPVSKQPEVFNGFHITPSAPPAPPPIPSSPGPPPPSPFERQSVRGKLKQVHWSKTPRPLIPQSIWEKPHDMTPYLNIRLLEEQFSLKEIQQPTTAGQKSPTGKQLLIDGKRAQNLGIFMSGLRNDTRRLIDVLNSVTEDDSFPAEKLSTIRRYQPTEDEIDMYKAYIDRRHELHPIDQFMLELCEIPCLSVRIDVCLTLWDFPWQYESAVQLVEQVNSACDELLNSQMLVLVLEYILAIGNHLNRHWSERNVSQGFLITSLDKVLDMRGKDSGYMMVNFLVDQLRSADPGLLQWPETVQVVRKCDQVSVKSVAAEIDVLKADLNKTKRNLKTLKAKTPNATRQDCKFQQDAQNLTIEYEMKLDILERQCADLQTKYRTILKRFGEPVSPQSDNLFAAIASFADKFRTAMKTNETKPTERKDSITLHTQF